MYWRFIKLAKHTRYIQRRVQDIGTSQTKYAADYLCIITLFIQTV